MFEIPIVDTHLHVWDVSKFRYPWLDTQPLLNGTILIDEYQTATQNCKVEKMVFVQCECIPEQHMQELDWVTKIANTEEPRIEGIVPWAPLELGEAVRKNLDKMKENKLVKGIRRMIETEAMDFCLQPDFIKGVQILEEYGYIFDLGTKYTQMDAILKFVDRVGPGVKFALNHLGKPGVKEVALDPWREQIKELACHENVYCKFSSLPSEADHKNWNKEQIRPFAEHIIECFGYDRLMFGTDWPPIERAASIDTCIQLTQEFTQGCMAEESRKLYYDNAIRFYNL